jgi:hypothetical protein
MAATKPPPKKFSIAHGEVFRAKGKQLQSFEGPSPTSQGKNLALTAFYVPTLLNSGSDLRRLKGSGFRVRDQSPFYGVFGVQTSDRLDSTPLPRQSLEGVNSFKTGTCACFFSWKPLL